MLKAVLKFMPKGEFEHYSDDTNSWNCTV